MSKRNSVILLIIIQLVLIRWGWDSHRFINASAVDHLPAEMFFFQDHRNYLSEHAVDPDTDSDPGYYHYIDIDFYPEFFSGELPHPWQSMINLYGQSVMEQNGIIPWVIEWWLQDLKELMQSDDWTNVWQVAAELGHYVGDSHQALHLTLNYNGQLTGNDGIHSRYETKMINPHLPEIQLPDTTVHYWESPIDSIFGYIDDIYPLVNLIMDADDRADGSSDYYALMWKDLGDTTIWSLQRAAIDLAALWYTAWMDAGSPYPPGVSVRNETISPESFQQTIYPNPFNSQTTLRVRISEPGFVSIRILDIRGQLVTTLTNEDYEAGEQEFVWNGLGRNQTPVASGVYFSQVVTQGISSMQKLTLIK